MRLRRSELSTPGSSEKMMRKAAGSDADLVFLDLEDAVAPREKAQSRAKVVDALTNLDWAGKTRAVRINSLDTHYAYRDIIEVVSGARDHLDVIIIPKVLAARDVWWVDCLLTQIETELGMSKRIGLEVLIEEVEGMTNIDEIARSSPRLEALIFGPGDYAASQGVGSMAVGGSHPDYPGDIWHYARNRVIVAARTAGIMAVDGPFAAFNDSEAYRREAVRSSALGFTGKWAIHPNQIEIANDVYTPDDSDVRRARKVASAYEEAMAEGLGAVAVDGEMVDAATVRLLRNILEKADLVAQHAAITEDRRPPGLRFDD